MNDHLVFSQYVLTTLVLSLRIAPVFVFAPPFSLVRIPKIFHWLMGIGMAATLVSSAPSSIGPMSWTTETLVKAAALELYLGLLPVLFLQLMFGALYAVGRTIDMQAGFGMSLIIDPATKGQRPLIGTLFAYIAGISFFAVDGHIQLYRFFSASLQLVPILDAGFSISFETVMQFTASVFVMAFGVGAAAIVALFVTDIAIAALSRTVPQLNALLLGIQVKALLVFVIVPVAIGMSGSLYVQLCTAMFQSIARAL